MSFSYDVVGHFIGLSLELVRDGETGTSQEVIRLLATDDGLEFIKALTDRHILESWDQDTRFKLLTTQILPFFRLITHPRLLGSNIMEQSVAMIYRFLVGINADRLCRMFKFVLELAADLQRSPIAEVPHMIILELSLSVLRKTIDCNTTSILNDGLHQIVEKFSNLMQASSATKEDFSRIQATRCLNYLQRRMAVGKGLKDYAEPRVAEVKQETFVFKQDLPGQLSSEGPRHDNDHADISKIQLMPTYGEIMASRNEYLPTTDSTQWHLPGIRGRLDREFRLLREDTVGQVRNAVRDILAQVRNSDHNQHQQCKNSARTWAYDQAIVHNARLDRVKGLELTIRCSQPDHIRRMDGNTMRDWWEQCKRLQVGALVCMVDAAGMIQFCTVAESTLRAKPKKDNKHSHVNEANAHHGKRPLTLSFSREHLYVRLHLVSNSAADVRQVLQWCHEIEPGPARYLVEFPGVLLASFKHTLEALQKRSLKPEMPFLDLVAPEAPPPTHDGELEISAPLFAQAPGFQFDLTCLAQDGQPFSARPGSFPSANEVSSRTGLDNTQAEAFLNTLSRELSLIQGPPGTGKSYTGEKIVKALVANKKKARLGPIICVCYTNHALDQLLEHVLDDGTKSIIRVGSSSKSKRLEGLNLRKVSEKMTQTKPEQSLSGELTRRIYWYEEEATRLFKELDGYGSLSSVRTHLRSHHPNHFRELFDESESKDRWKLVDHKGVDAIEYWLRGGNESNTASPGNPRHLPELLSASLLTMTRPEKTSLYQHWLGCIRDAIIDDLVDMVREHKQAKENRDRVRQELKCRCLEEADVVGFTTTGLARELNLVEKLPSKVVVCEEAGEVLEAHLLTALLPSVEHAILIGDHLQLRPSIKNYDLQSTNPRGEQYSLDKSLFERLVQPPHLSDPRLPFSCLETQRRMHPSIAEMVRSTLYNSLQDGENVHIYPEVVGMSQRLRWFDHNQLEAGTASFDPQDTSHTNDYEVQMAAALVSHLIKQGEYDPQDIAVITPYLGQLQKLRWRLGAESAFGIAIDDRDLEELGDLEAAAPQDQVQTRSQQSISKTTVLRSVRLATVDNFQGEEAKVVVISLVRSNPQNKCGFLGTSNRINVLLSRAKHGCYIIGNSKTYLNVPMWSQIIDLLRAGGNFGTTLDLRCPRHPERHMSVSQPDHFAMFSPDGGCNTPCDRRLNCGHACTAPCHSDVLHRAVNCHEECPRFKSGCDHPCPRECGEPCEDKCYVQLENIVMPLPCGHSMSSAKCWETQDPGAVMCPEMVERTIPGCDHVVKKPCHIDVTSSSFKCDVECGQILPCGHTCRRPCHKCRTRKDGRVVGVNHGDCQQTCDRDYTICRHTCQKKCHGEARCPPCTRPCEVRCSHSRCSKTCHEPCAPCAEECSCRCPHSECTMPCAAPCDRVPCSRRCSLALPCGHQCPSLCGEACPDARYCQQCGPEEIRSMEVDYITMSEYKDIDLDEDPCVFPDCGHFLTVASMDGQMSMGDHYDLDENGTPIAIKAPLRPFVMDGVKVSSCAKCRRSLRDVARYGRIRGREVLDETTKKFLQASNNKYKELVTLLMNAENQLENGPGEGVISEKVGRSGETLDLTAAPRDQIAVLDKWTGTGRYKGMQKVYRAIAKYRREVQARVQPFQKVADLVKHANRKKRVGPYTFDESVVQFRGYIFATSLLLRCHIMVLSDLVTYWAQAEPLDRVKVTVNFAESMAQCEELVGLAEETARPQVQAEGHIYHAQLCGIALTLGNTQWQDATPTEQDTRRESLKATGLEHVGRARGLLEGRAWPRREHMARELEAAARQLEEGAFYRAVSGEEVRAVYAAMASDLLGTGHWYTCARGHPFTVGECGMPMERARCPECGAPVGGLGHVNAEGVRRAEEIEALARGVGEAQL